MQELSCVRKTIGLIDVAFMVSRRDGPAARSTGISCAKGNNKPSSDTTLHSAGRISSIAQLRCPSAQLIGFEFGREVSGPLSYNTGAVPGAPETEDARARAIAEPRGLPHCEAAPREGADSNGNSYYGLTEEGLAQTMGSGAAGCQERQANPGICLRNKTALVSAATPHHWSYFRPCARQ
jgi:hypothetical protein